MRGVNSWFGVYRNTEDEIAHGVMCIFALAEEKYYGFMIIENEPALYEKENVEENFMIYDMDCDGIFETKTKIEFRGEFEAPECLEHQEETEDQETENI